MRVMDSVQRLVAAHPAQTVVVVTHGGVLDMIYRTARLLGLSGPRQATFPTRSTASACATARSTS